MLVSVLRFELRTPCSQGRCATDHQALDRLDQDVDRRDVDVLLDARQPGLVDEPDHRFRIVHPLNRVHHRVSFFPQRRIPGPGGCALQPGMQCVV